MNNAVIEIIIPTFILIQVKILQSKIQNFLSDHNINYNIIPISKLHIATISSDNNDLQEQVFKIPFKLIPYHRYPVMLHELHLIPPNIAFRLTLADSFRSGFTQLFGSSLNIALAMNMPLFTIQPTDCQASITTMLQQQMTEITFSIIHRDISLAMFSQTSFSPVYKLHLKNGNIVFLTEREILDLEADLYHKRQALKNTARSVQVSAKDRVKIANLHTGKILFDNKRKSASPETLKQTALEIGQQVRELSDGQTDKTTDSAANKDTAAAAFSEAAASFKTPMTYPANFQSPPPSTNEID